MKAIEVILAYAEALERGDIPTAFSFFSSDVKWNQPGANQFSGLKKGAGEIGNMLRGMMEISKGSFALRPNGDIMTNGDFVVMPVRFNGNIDDRKIDMSGIDLFKVEKEKITDIWLFSDDQGAEDIFWGK